MGSAEVLQVSLFCCPSEAAAAARNIYCQIHFEDPKRDCAIEDGIKT